MTSSYIDTPTTTELLKHYRKYAEARREFMAQLHRPTSCRDPLAEMSELLVAQLLSAKIAPLPVQKGYDLIGPDDRLIQVKYLANSSKIWVNEHTIRFTDGIHDYVLVIFTNLEIENILLFPRETLAQVCQLLKKQHPQQNIQLRFTRANYNAIIQHKDKFLELGIKVF